MRTPKEIKKEAKDVDIDPNHSTVKVLSAYPEHDWDRPIELAGGPCWNRRGMQKVIVVDEEGRAAVEELSLQVIQPKFVRKPDGHLGAVGE